MNEETTIDEFLTFVLEGFVLSLEQHASSIKVLISQNLTGSIFTKLKDLQEDITTLFGEKEVKEIVNSVVDARTDMFSVFSEIESWFDISSENRKSIRNYSFVNIVEIALASTKRVHQSFDPKLTFTDCELNNRFHSNMLESMVDAFKILLSNIQEHGKDDRTDIFVKVLDQKNNLTSSKLKVVISNPVLESDVNFERLEQIRHEIATNTHKTREEGGSGFHKLLALPYVARKEDLDFSYSDGCFRVEVTFTLLIM